MFKKKSSKHSSINCNKLIEASLLMLDSQLSCPSEPGKQQLSTSPFWSECKILKAQKFKSFSAKPNQDFVVPVLQRPSD